MAHRLAWLYMTGEWPKSEMVDHENTVRNDNRWSNLRDSTRTVNMENQRQAHKGSQSGLLGVSPRPNGAWVAQIQVSRKKLWLGEFSTPEQASTAYIEAKRRLHAGCTI